MSNTFYQTRHLTLDQKRDLLFSAMALSNRWWVDVLDCSKSWFRQPIDMPFTDAANLLDEQCHFTVIRRQHPPENHFEVAFSTPGDPCYFVWVNVSVAHAAIFDVLHPAP